MESRKYLAGMSGREERVSTRGGLGLGLDLGTGREEGKWRGRAASSCWRCKRTGNRGEEGGAKAEGDKSDVGCGGQGPSETNTVLATCSMCFKNAGMSGTLSNR